ncbi:aldo-keto reductase family 1 member B1-like [Cylas formicarius]|uniref:aldo-keto reductase family 1 member B1-like n=1 Tax=Cylas formicarius TaxID=197179 RepID=UPI00295854B7|nr:aldo-keto reductase family 1 member B1-like [Cylas formicarius]XP_060531339.1 aldo-keto reductase family 1 member B1-like [Cylas formicarius]
MTSADTYNLNNGLKIPALGLGTFTVTDEKLLETAIDTALEVGYRHIDTAYIYRNEHIIGKTLKKWFDSGKLKRDQVFVTTKLSSDGVHPERLENQLKESLKNLQLEYVDLYLIHFPIGTKPRAPGDTATDIIAEPTDHISIWKIMEKQVEDGRTKSIGVSNFNEKQIENILKNAKIKPACNQVEVHVYLPQNSLVKFCQDNGIVVIAYSPLGNPGINEFRAKLGRPPQSLPDMLNDTLIKQIAEKHKKSAAQVMLKFLLQRKIAVIPKSITPSRIKENFDLFNFSLDDSDLKLLDSLKVGEKARVCNFSNLHGFKNHPEWPFPSEE